MTAAGDVQVGHGGCATSRGMRRSAFVLVCSGAVLLATGCGSSSQQLSKAEFQTRANHVCSDLTRREKPDVSSTSRAALDRNISRLDSALGDLDDLHPPASDAARYQALLTNFRKGVGFFKANESILILLTRQLQKHPADNATAARYDQLVRPFVHDIQQANAAATALGLKECAKGFSGGSSG
jgi:hypothetical protein